VNSPEASRRRPRPQRHPASVPRRIDAPKRGHRAE
jgi:hypothetical protein